MKLQQAYTVQADDTLQHWAGDYILGEDVGGFAVESVTEADHAAKLVVWVPVNPAGLTVEMGSHNFENRPADRGIRVPEFSKLRDLRESALRVLSFATGCLLAATNMRLRPELIPQSQADEDRLIALDSVPVWLDTSAAWASRPPQVPGLDQKKVGRLFEREVGLALYLDSRRMTSATGSVRELWRVLESAFGQKDDALVELLASFAPAVDLGFDSQELRQLLVLRGRASHSESSAGLAEYHAVSKMAAEAVPRLRTLVEAVLVTKRSWGSKGTGVDSLAPLRSYVTKEGHVMAIPQCW